MDAERAAVALPRAQDEVELAASAARLTVTLAVLPAAKAAPRSAAIRFAADVALPDERSTAAEALTATSEAGKALPPTAAIRLAADVVLPGEPH